MKCKRLSVGELILRGTVAYYDSGTVNLFFGNQKGIRVAYGNIRFISMFIISVDSLNSGQYFTKQSKTTQRHENEV